MNINKTEGAIISLLIASVYVYVYYQFVKGNAYWFGWSVLFSFGALLCFFRRNLHGGRLLFAGAPTHSYWEAGYCFVPSIFHMLHNIGIHLLWDLEEREPVNANVHINSYQDQRESQYHVRANVSLFWLNFDKLISLIVGWFFGFKRGEEKLLYQRVGFRIILVSIVGGFVCNWFFPRPVNADTPSVFSNFFQSSASTSGTAGQIPDGYKIRDLSAYQPKTGMPMYFPFAKECIVVHPEAGAIIQITSHITILPYADTDQVLALNPEGWVPRNWREVKAAMPRSDQQFDSSYIIGIPRSQTSTIQKTICF